jgi:hypothetical protein
MSVSIFFCYAHEDEALLKKLKAHLIPLQRQRVIDLWHDRDISAGTEWEQEISHHLNAAQIILLLVSPDFMASDYCYGIEMKRALERHQRGEARVIPIILRHVYWQGILGTLQALPTDAKTVKSWLDPDEAFFEVTEGIRKVVEGLMIKPPRVSTKGTEPQLTPKMTSSPTLSGNVPPQEDVTQPMITQQKQVIEEGSSITVPLPRTEPASKPEAVTTSTSHAFSLIRSFEAHSAWLGLIGAVYTVAISPDGQIIVSGSDDKAIEVWNLSTGNLLQTLEAHTDQVRSVAISPDGQTLVSGSKDKTIKIWEKK